MDTNGKASKSGQISMSDNNKSSPAVAGAEVVVVVSGEDSKARNSGDSAQKLSASGTPMSCPSPEIARFCPSPNKPPKIPTTETLTRRKSLSRSVLSKPKSRFGEHSVAIDSNLLKEISSEMQQRTEESAFSPINKITSTTSTLKETLRTASMTPRTPLMKSPGGVRGEDEEDERIFKKVSSQRKLKYHRVKMKVLIEWVVFLCILGTFVASLTVHELQHYMIWGLEVWKWCLLVLVTFSGMLVTKWSIRFLVFLIERNFLFKKNVLYFVHGLKKSVQVCIWLSLVLLTWVLLFNHGVDRSAKTTRIFDSVTGTIVSLLIGTFLWLLKTLLLKILASSFHINRLFDRIQEAIFHQYVLQTLSGPPVMESVQMIGRTNSTSRLSLQIKKKGKQGKKEVIDIDKLYKMKQEKVSAWTMKGLVDVISSSGLSTISNTLDESFYDGEGEQTDKEITNEMEAIAAGYHIFNNVAHIDGTYIYAEDLRRFMINEEVDVVFPLFEGSESGRIDKEALMEWVVKVYKGRKALAHALNDTKTAVKQLNKLLSGILVVVMIIVWLLLVQIATTKVLVVLSSQLVVAAFMFGNTCKTIFEAIIFVFVMHPFDVGDRCVIDGVQMVVEEMNILTTVFLRYDNEMIYYPNSVLATKPISNFYRSPENMGDNLEFSIDFKTPVEKIGALKDKIKEHLEKNSLHWHPNHIVMVKEIESVNKIKMALIFNHKMNFQDYGEKHRRRSELVIEMKNIFEKLGINYNLLPQEVHLVDLAMTTGAAR